MSYELLTSLYFGEGSNADLTSHDKRELLHIQTPLEGFITRTLSAGLDVVLTGNPGDGKSHLVRILSERNALAGAEYELDLSAKPTRDVVQRWSATRKKGQQFVLCGNEGPLIELIDSIANEEVLRPTSNELKQQLRRLLVDSKTELPPEPKEVMLVDLADRSVLDPQLVESALQRVGVEEFLPDLGIHSTECSAGQNILMLNQSAEARRRLSKLLVLSGRLCGEHITFRQLWGAVAFSISAAKAPSTLRVELSRDDVGPGWSLLDNLSNPRGDGLLLEAFRRFADPAIYPAPNVDEGIWSSGKPDSGQWLTDFTVSETPSSLWANGKQDEALKLQRALKRFVALAHERGEALIEGISRNAALLSPLPDEMLRKEAISGLRRLYLERDQENAAPSWLREGLPLWLGFSYEAEPLENRPQVAVDSIPSEQFTIRRPLRAPWLGSVLGPLPEIAWLHHEPSGISLRLDPVLFASLRNASSTAGPISIPEAVHRFLVRLAGWEEERSDAATEEQMSVLKQPRGTLITAARLQRLESGGARYV